MRPIKEHDENTKQRLRNLDLRRTARQITQKILGPDGAVATTDKRLREAIREKVDMPGGVPNFSLGPKDIAKAILRVGGSENQHRVIATMHEAAMRTRQLTSSNLTRIGRIKTALLNTKMARRLTPPPWMERVEENSAEAGAAQAGIEARGKEKFARVRGRFLDPMHLPSGVPTIERETKGERQESTSVPVQKVDAMVERGEERVDLSTLTGQPLLDYANKTKDLSDLSTGQLNELSLISGDEKTDELITAIRNARAKQFLTKLTSK